MRGIGFVKTHQIARERINFLSRVLADQVLVQPLQGELTGAGAGAFFASAVRRRWAGGGLGHGGLDHQPMRSSRLVISTATCAASRPFSSCRAWAWARFSVVKIAFTTGTW